MNLSVIFDFRPNLNVNSILLKTARGIYGVEMQRFEVETGI